MLANLDYHRGQLAVALPEGRVAVMLNQPHVVVPSDQVELVTAALARPTGTPPLLELAAGRKTVCIAIPDVTRPMPNRTVLPPLLETIERAGVPAECVLILIATGLHRPNTAEELAEMVGERIVSRYRIENHVARDAAAHADLGRTSTGVPVRVDRRYVEADLKILTGLVEPHFMAGFSGGRKLVCPGLASASTIHAFHAPALIEDPRSANCVLDGNPTHRTSTEAAGKAGVDFTLNVVLSADRRIVSAHAGALDAAFLEAAERARALATVPLDEPGDIVIVTGGGYPLDATWYQTIKGLVAAIPAVKKGGTILVASGLSEGIGSPDFTRLMRETRDLDAFMCEIQRPGVFREEQWQLEEFVHVARHAGEILLYSDGLPRAEQEGLFVTPVASPAEGLAHALKRHGPDARIVIMPHGPYVLPRRAR